MQDALSLDNLDLDPPLDKRVLSPRDILVVAYAHIILGVEQHKLAAMYAVNGGRVAEAITAIRFACEHHKVINRTRAKLLTQGAN